MQTHSKASITLHLKWMCMNTNGMKIYDVKFQRENKIVCNISRENIVCVVCVRRCSCEPNSKSRNQENQLSLLLLHFICHKKWIRIQTIESIYSRFDLHYSCTEIPCEQQNTRTNVWNNHLHGFSNRFSSTDKSRLRKFMELTFAVDSGEVNYMWVQVRRNAKILYGQHRNWQAKAKQTNLQSAFRRNAKQKNLLRA